MTSFIVGIYEYLKQHRLLRNLSLLAVTVCLGVLVLQQTYKEDMFLLLASCSTPHTLLRNTHRYSHGLWSKRHKYSGVAEPDNHQYCMGTRRPNIRD